MAGDSGVPIADGERLRAYVRKALEEDGAGRDCTTEYLSIGSDPLEARLIVGSAGTIAGLEVARLVFEERDPGVGLVRNVEDGTVVRGGDVVACVSGPGDAILAAERVALNFLQHLSGVATLTARYVEETAGKGPAILDTRKTTPLMRELERYAVRVGGGANHRFNLSDMVLIKENHVRAVGGAKKLVELLRKRKAPLVVEVEVDSLDFLRQVLDAPADRIMLDNFTPDQVRKAVEMVTSFHARSGTPPPRIEVSGGIDVDTIGSYAVAGVDFISIGALTHSAPALDISLEVRS